MAERDLALWVAHQLRHKYPISNYHADEGAGNAFDAGRQSALNDFVAMYVKERDRKVEHIHPHLRNGEGGEDDNATVERVENEPN